MLLATHYPQADEGLKGGALRGGQKKILITSPIIKNAKFSSGVNPPYDIFA